MEITKIQANCPEDQGFWLDRPDIGEQYIFLHYQTPVILLLGGEEVELPSGSCILHSPHSHQRFSSPECSLLHDWFHVRGDLAPVLNKCGFDCDRVYRVSNGGPISRLVARMEEECLTQPPHFEAVLELKLQELFYTILRESDDGGRLNRIPSDTRKRFLALRSRISTGYGQAWDIPAMAAETGFSPSRFCRLYKEIFQIPPKKDLQLIRVEQAKRLLSQHRYTVGEVAELCGYTNPYHFIRTFREQTGITPGGYAAKHSL